MPVAGNPHRTLTETAAGYLGLGWSVVPLWGDTKPDQAKVAAVVWGPYQRRRATADVVNRWFSSVQYAGLGIVTGHISQLLVLDFDDPALGRAFEQAMPELAATRTVLTQRGRHLYFQIPPHVHAASRKLVGADLLFEGRYVVAPPTVIDGHEYQVERGGRPKTLDQADVDRINTFLDRHCAVESSVRPNGAFGLVVATHREKPQEAAFSCEGESLPSAPATSVAEVDNFLTAEGLVHLYRGMTHQSSRNVALFKTSCLARDHGWKYEAAVAVLASVHAAEPPSGRHAVENLKARRREAIRTIRSAFSKPPRPPRPKDTGGLFNSIREKLMQLGQTCVVRVLEGLRLAGLKAGQLVSERTVRNLLNGFVGRHSIRLALAAETPSGHPIFERISPRYPPRGAAATQIRIDKQKHAFVNCAKPDKSSGRPETWFRIPSSTRLCQRLDVAPSGSDPIDLDDLQTAQKTRQALHRGLIQRRPALYLRKWLGDRLGVSGTTIWRYCRQIPGLNVVPTFTQTPIGWFNLNAIPNPDVTPAGTCLEDTTGKRWPAVKGIAQKLLAQGRGVRLLVRSLNYYWCGQGDPPVTTSYHLQRTIDVAPVVSTGEPSITFGQAVERLVRTVGSRQHHLPVQADTAQELPQRYVNTSMPYLGPGYTKRNTRRHHWGPLANPDWEAAAVWTQQQVNMLIEAENEKLSLASARRWVEIFGVQAVETAVKTLHSRPDVRKPAGWLSTLIRTSENG